jgi:hypothetical protein
MIELFIYLANVSDKLNGLLVSVGLVGIVAGSLGWIISYNEQGEEAVRIFRNIAFGSFAMLFFGCFVPSSNTLYTIAAAHYGQEAVQSEMAVKVKHLLDLKLDEMLKEAELHK